MLEVAGGDSFGGATPPISNFFEDKPTPPIMNMMGIDVDALGNHNFDRGRSSCERADPARAVPDVREHRLPEREDAGRVVAVDTFNSGTGSRSGSSASRTSDTPEVTSRAISIRSRSDRRAAVNAEAAKLANKTDVIVALGHEGATAGTVTEPTGPLIDIADGVSMSTSSSVTTTTSR